MRKALVALSAAFLVTAVLPAVGHAAVSQLTFEGLKDQEAILNFYNGGTGSLGSSGPNYGISFGSDSLAVIDSDNGGSANIANEPSPNTIAAFKTGSGVVMNVAAGFTNGFSFYYSGATTGSVRVYDGPNATGTVLATLPLPVNAANGGCTGDPTGQFCHWDPVGVTFAGTAQSVSFAAAVNTIGFDNITLGSDDPTPEVAGAGQTNPAGGKPVNQFTISAFEQSQSGTLNYTAASKTFKGTIQCVAIVGNAATLVAVDATTGLANQTMVQDNGASGDKLVNTQFNPATVSAKQRAKLLACSAPDLAKLAAAPALLGDYIHIKGSAGNV